MLARILTVDAVTKRSPVTRFVADWNVTESSLPARIVKLASKKLSSVLISTVSTPTGVPMLSVRIVIEFVGFKKRTDSLRLESMNEYMSLGVASSDSEMVSVASVKSKSRSATSRLSRIGSSPVNVMVVEPSDMLASVIVMTPSSPSAGMASGVKT